MPQNTMKIGSKLMLLFSLVLCIASAQAVFSLWQLRAVGTEAQSLATDWLPSVAAASRMHHDAAEVRMAMMRHAVQTTPAGRDAAEKELRSNLAQFERSRAAYVGLISSPQEKALFDEVNTSWKAYADGIPAFLKTSSNAASIVDALALVNGTMRDSYAHVDDALQKIAKLNSDGGDRAGAAAAALFSRAQSLLIGSLAVMVVLTLVLAWRFSQGLSARVVRAMAATDAMAEGRLDQAISVEGTDELGQLLHSLKRMQGNLHGIVSGVRQNAESVATASAQIAHGNDDLSSRTEQQASALEETAATMEQLGSTVRQNADNARQANQLALGASSVAVQGGEVVGRVVDTMKGINDSSRRIADIISVIDGIAFQTNILALNAAVEAARAGEQGRGFAVVAGEVRTLAQRCAEAAKEIKSLITASVEQVDQGSALVDQAGTTMTEVVASIRRVTDIMGEISAASSEQSAGVAQAGEAVTQMDRATQQNAALVQESAAAAQSLREQAQQLVQAVAVFRLSGSEPAAKPGATTPPRPSAISRGASAASAAAAAAAAPRIAVAFPTPQTAAKPTTPPEPPDGPGGSPAPKIWVGQERRQPTRATNVVRPAFKTPASVSPRGPSATAPAMTASDDWESF